MQLKFPLPLLAVGVATLCANSPIVHAQTDPRNNWSLTPLGPDVAPPEWKPAPVRQPLKTGLQTYPAQGAALTFAQNGQPTAVIVLLQAPSSAAQEAAELLQRVFKAMSGATLPIVSEKDVQAKGAAGFEVGGQSYNSLIALGATQLAEKAGINTDGLALDGYRLQTQGNVLFLVGQDRAPRLGKDGQPLRISNNGTLGYVHATGTRNGAYGLLERHFGCRWLWPAEAGGEVLPARNELILQPLHETDQPAMAQRLIRNYYPENRVNAYGRRQQQGALPMLGRSYTSLLDKSKNSADWFKAQRLGQSVEMNLGHAFSGYWKQYGQTHPEWFALQADGTRNQARLATTSGYERLDKTNPELINFIAQEIIAKFDADPDLKSASVCPNDGSYPSFCLCEVCRLLDPPQGDKIGFSIIGQDGKAQRISYPSLSDRHVTFYSRIAEIVGKKHPDRLLGAYAYSVYNTPPLYAKLAPNVFISYVGLSYVNDTQRERDRKSWESWANTAGKVQLRHNSLLGANGIPALFTHKLSEDIKRTYETGMIGMDFDSLTHNWAGRGLNYYILAKLAWDPSLDVDALTKDYCDSGFGPASPAIQQYFARLEAITSELAQKTGAAARSEDGIDAISLRGMLGMVARTYTPEKLGELKALLNTAKIQAGNDAAVQKRIVFLEQALRYADVETAALRAYFASASPDKKQRVQEALKNRLAVFQYIYDNHFYSQGLFETLHRHASLWREFGLDGAGNELPKTP